MRIRPFENKDLDRCQEMTRSQDDYGEYARIPNYHFLVAEDESDRVAGFGAAHFWQWNRSSWIVDIYVDPAYRGKGYGQALIRALSAAMQERGARVLFERVPVNHPALAFYTRLGFTICGMNTKFFDAPVPERSTALTLSLDL